MVKANDRYKYFPELESVGFRSILILACIHIFWTAVTAIVAAAAKSTFVFWYGDAFKLVLGVLIFMTVLGILWDGSLIIVGIVGERFKSHIPRRLKDELTLLRMRKRRFFTLGPWPIAMICVTTIGVLGSSNLTLLNIKLLGDVTEWRDPVFWEIEGELFELIVAMPIDAMSWDRLYHSAWIIELTAAFVLTIISRNSEVLLRYCTSMVILFYFGRYIGLITPVMGPGIFKPELFGYLSGSYTGIAMNLVGSVMMLTPDQAKEVGGILLGGVSAMPSLHVGMVALTAYWLAAAKRWTLFVSVPWVLMVWTSTVFLGWHYILDGAGGIVLGAAAIWATYKLLGKINARDSALPVSSGHITTDSRKTNL